MTFQDYLKEVRHIQKMYGIPSKGNMRVGQCFYDALPDEMIGKFTATDKDKLDPFYNSNNIPAFLVWVYENWPIDKVD